MNVSRSNAAAASGRPTLAELQNAFAAHVHPQIGDIVFEPVDPVIRRMRLEGAWRPTIDGLEAIRLGYGARIDTILGDIHGRGVRPATDEELFLLMGSDPNAVLRRHSPLAALGSVASVDGFQNILYAQREKQGAGLYLHWHDSDFHSRFWYLVKKELVPSA